MDLTQTDTVVETTKTEPVATDGKVTEGAAEKELTAFQKFFAELFAPKKEEPSKADDKAKSDPAVKTGAKTYTEADLTAAIEAQKQKWSDEKAEQERLSKLPPEQREKEAIANALAENAKLTAEITRRDLQSKAVTALSKDGYPVGLADLLNYSDEMSMLDSLEKLTNLYKQSITEGVSAKLRGKTPAGLGGASSAENMLQDKIAKNIRGGMN